MYEILIVDDESYFRTYLKSCISWEDYNFQICGEASNAEKALKMLPDHTPDIILADIHMAGMNGIEFSRIVKQSYPNIHIILITGYNEFESAKQAVKLGVSNFISKPFEKSELIDSLLKVKKELYDRNNQKNLLASLQTKYEDTAPVAKRTILYSLLAGESSSDHQKAEHEIKRFGIALPAFPAAALIMESNPVRECSAPAEKAAEEDFQRLIGRKCLFFTHRDLLIGLVELDGDKVDDRLLQGCQRFLSNWKCRFPGDVTIGVGTACSSFSQLTDSYRKASIALRNKFLLGNNHVISYQSLKISDSISEMYPFGLKNDLLMYARLLDREKVRSTISEIYHSLRRKTIQIDFVYILYTELMSNCFSFLAEYGYASSEVFGPDFSPFEILLKQHTIQEVSEYVESVYLKVISFLRCKKRANSVGAVKKAKEYIDQNYFQKNLTIEDVSRKVFFHPSYLRLLFKKEMGITINEYITSIRMEKAKELLSKNRLSNSDVAERVGYSDAAYFSKCFKKYYKVNPSDFEKSLNPR